jgi:Spy/CpxP family protein refolding chaperone
VNTSFLTEIEVRYTNMKRHLFQFAVVTALASGIALAQPPATGTQPAPPNAPFTHPMFGHEQMMQALNLTAEQKQQVKTIFGDAKQKAEPIRQEMRQNREALYTAVKANNTSQIERLSAHQGELQGKALAIRSEAMARFYAILTPEQRIKADQMHQEMQSRMRQRMEDRMRERESERRE